jgi:hypothetical protein
VAADVSKAHQSLTVGRSSSGVVSSFYLIQIPEIAENFAYK